MRVWSPAEGRRPHLSPLLSLPPPKAPPTGWLWPGLPGSRVLGTTASPRAGKGGAQKGRLGKFSANESELQNGFSVVLMIRC